MSTEVRTEFLTFLSPPQLLRRNNFNKLLALNLTQFERVVILDNDCVALRSIDDLAWSVPTPAAACHPRCDRKGMSTMKWP